MPEVAQHIGAIKQGAGGYERWATSLAAQGLDALYIESISIGA